MKSSPFWKGVSSAVSENSETILAFSARVLYAAPRTQEDISPWKNSRLPGNVYSKKMLKRNTSTHVLGIEWFLLLLLAVY